MVGDSNYLELSLVCMLVVVCTFVLYMYPVFIIAI